MQVRDLAPALIALGDAVSAIARLADPAAEPPGLAIKATDAGSFIVFLQVTDPSLLQRVQEMLVGDGITAALNLREIVVAVGGAFLATKWLRGRRLRKVEVDKPRPGYVRVVDENGDSIEVPSVSWRAVQDVDFREAAREAIRPVEQHGIDRIEIRAAQDAVEVSKDDRPAFEVPAVIEEVILDAESETVLRLVNVAFNEDHKWKVSEGDVTYWVQIEDMGFLERVARGVETFSSGDLLRVQLRHQQWATAAGPRSERSVIEVLDHIEGPRQIALPFSDQS